MYRFHWNFNYSNTCYEYLNISCHIWTSQTYFAYAPDIIHKKVCNRMHPFRMHPVSDIIRNRCFGGISIICTIVIICNTFFLTGCILFVCTAILSVIFSTGCIHFVCTLTWCELHVSWQDVYFSYAPWYYP